MTDSWNEMRLAKEGQYFEKQNNRALQNLKRTTPRERNSPITGKPMRTVLLEGMLLDVCEDTGGLWIDKDELLEVLRHIKSPHGETWLELLADIMGFTPEQIAQEPKPSGLDYHEDGEDENDSLSKNGEGNSDEHHHFKFNFFR